MTEEELYTTYKGRYVSKSVHSPESLKYYEEFTFRPDDIIISTYPKSGTIWTKQIVSLIQSGGDLTLVMATPLWKGVPWLETLRYKDTQIDRHMASPRLFATHFHYDMMPASFHQVKPKVIHVMRNPRDVFTSYYHFSQMSNVIVTARNTEEYLHKFLSGQVMMGSWFDHVKGWLTQGQPHVMHISYEEMIQDLRDSVARISEFIGKPLSSEVIEKIADHCEFKNMRRFTTTSYTELPKEILDQSKSTFLRKGVVGDWKNLLTAEQVERFHRAYQDNMKDVRYKSLWDSNGEATSPDKGDGVLQPVTTG